VACCKGKLCLYLYLALRAQYWLLHSAVQKLTNLCCVCFYKVLYGCETWSLTLREERRLRVFENRVLRRVFGPKRDEVTGEW